ncbi:hypothetical protein HHK36_020287 [Tetracentron sinense]|uniref:Uncharacterized protein n=1 Tax=Tetracentron sinense TaxID=13715 RepID=A0A835DAT7_TETSI|nr:hypothetical protein HHK36_020287 [Tetracentron sinense]
MLASTFLPFSTPCFNKLIILCLIVAYFASVPYHGLLNADVRIIGHIALHPAKTAYAPNQILLNAIALTSPSTAPLNLAGRKTRVIK